LNRFATRDVAARFTCAGAFVGDVLGDILTNGVGITGIVAGVGADEASFDVFVVVDRGVGLKDAGGLGLENTGGVDFEGGFTG